jgi:molecular chaperone GrpE (heat shock protein)
MEAVRTGKSLMEVSREAVALLDAMKHTYAARTEAKKNDELAERIVELDRTDADIREQHRKLCADFARLRNQAKDERLDQHVDDAAKTLGRIGELLKQQKFVAESDRASLEAPDDGE